MPDLGLEKDLRAASDGAPKDVPEADGAPQEDAVRDVRADSPVVPLALRIMAANLTSGNYQTYDEGHGVRIMQAFVPDVVLIQEFNVGDNSPAAVRAFVDSTFGSTFEYVRGTGLIPNGVISRYPISEGGEWIDGEAQNRDFAWAKIALPGGRSLWAVSVHWLSGNTAGSRRHKEANELLAHLQANVPAQALVVVGGDLNTETRAEGSVNVLKGVLVVDGPYPADQDGNDNTNSSRLRPFDWLLASGPLHAASAKLVVGSNEFDHGLVFDSRVYQPLSDVPPVLVDDSGANQMQHMAVVRQFAWP